MRKIEALEIGFNEFKPEFVLYNAGTDILAGDPLGNLNISAQGIARRDQFVFELCLERDVPLCMLLSGGYSQESAQTIASSIENLKDQGLIKWE